MIQKAVFSYFNPDESFGNRCGFMRYSDFLFTTALSVLCASRHFKEVQFISSDWGLDVITRLKLPITSYSDKLNEMKSVSRFFWAYGKLLAYCEQTQPFVHIDNDVFLFDPLPKRILNARLCFQSYEPFDKEGYMYYNMLKECWAKAPVRPQVIVDNEVTDFAYNCGICGGWDLDIFEEHRKCSAEYIFAEKNQKTFFVKFGKMLIHQNLFHEQYFLACLIKKHNLRKKVVVINEDAVEAGKNPLHKYTHLWGTTKIDKGNMARVRLRLRDEDRALFDRVEQFCIKNKI
jgi:hypothetical protein